MRNLVLLLFFPVLAFAQTDNTISVVSAERLNVVYRGVPNLIKVAVPGAKSFTVTSDSLVQIKADTVSKGLFTIYPGAGNKMILKIKGIMKDGGELYEEKTFRIKNLPMLLGQIKDHECRECPSLFMTKKEIAEAEVKVNWEDFLFIAEPELLNIYGFTVSFPDKIKATIRVDGHKMNSKVIKTLQNLKVGDIVYIDQIQYLKDTTHIIPRKAQPIVIEISN